MIGCKENNVVVICLDLEMTGLLEHDEILEVACVVTDGHSMGSEGFSKVVATTEDKLGYDGCVQEHA